MVAADAEDGDRRFLWVLFCTSPGLAPRYDACREKQASLVFGGDEGGTMAAKESMMHSYDSAACQSLFHPNPATSASPACW